MSDSPVKRILILAANPKNTSRLRLDEEVREIEAGLQRSRGRDQFEIICKLAVRTDDLRRALLDYEPQIVHFSGHGAGTQGLVFENHSGEMQLVSTESLTRLFKLFKDKLECVFFNACYSEAQAQAIHQHIDYVIGMNEEIGDRAAIEFAVGFYDALGAGRTYKEAYEFGCASIDLEGIPESSTPVLKSPEDISTSLDLSSPKFSLEQLQDELEEVGERNADPRGKIKPETVISTSIKSAFLLENPEGQVPVDSIFYIERPPIEIDCYRAITQPGTIIRIESPRQVGKTSLMYRILQHCKQQGYETASVNFQSADEEFLTSTDLFLQWFCASVTYELNFHDKLADYWVDSLNMSSLRSSNYSCTNYFQKYLLPTCGRPLVIGIDEIDALLEHPKTAKNFFGLLQSWHEKAKTIEVWKNFRLVTAGAKDPNALLILNDALPFDVAKTIWLPEFNQIQIQDLVQRHGIDWSTSQVEQLMNMVGGHPYLVRVALYVIARRELTLEKFLQVAHTEDGPYGDHLRRHLLNLERESDLVIAMKQLINSETVKLQSFQAFQFRQWGLVKLQGGYASITCGLYRKYFFEHL